MNETEISECVSELKAVFPGVASQWNDSTADVWAGMFRRWPRDAALDGIRRHRLDSEYQTCQPVHIESRIKGIMLERQRARPQFHGTRRLVDWYREQLGQRDGDDVGVVYIWFDRVLRALSRADGDGLCYAMAAARGHMKSALTECGIAAEQAHAMASEMFGIAPAESFLKGA